MTRSHPFANALLQMSTSQLDSPTAKSMGPYPHRPSLYHVTSAPELRSGQAKPYKIAPQRLGDLHTVTQVALPRRKPTRGGFVKQAEKVSLILEDQDPTAACPIYGQEGKLSGVVSIANTTGIVRVTVKLRGVIDTRDFAGLGKSVVMLFNDVVAQWDVSGSEPGPCPSTIAFKRRLPTHYTDDRSGKPYPIPPSYDYVLAGFPGFKVKVKYAVVVEMKEKTSLWKRSSGLECPFSYQPRTRPRRGQSFPPNFNKAVSDPVTLFAGLAQGTVLADAIHTQLYMPMSQIFCMDSVIPFHIRLTARDGALEPFATFPPPSGSFLPECSTSSLSPTIRAFRSSSLMPPCLQLDSPNQKKGYAALTGLGSAHLSLELTRTTMVDAERFNTSSGLYERKELLKTVIVGETTFGPPWRGPGYISWSGELRVSKFIECGGFIASNVRVSDALVFRVMPPGATSASRLRQIIPVHLTTDPSDRSDSEKSSTLPDPKVLELY